MLSPTEIETSEPLKSSSRLANSKASPYSISMTTLLLSLSTFRTPLMPSVFLRITFAYSIFISPFTQIAIFLILFYHEIAFFKNLYYLPLQECEPLHFCLHYSNFHATTLQILPCPTSHHAPNKSCYRA